MYRDFSENAKQKLIEYVKDVTETSLWNQIGDWFGDAGLQVQHWLGLLNISRYVDDVDTFHKKVLDKNNTTASRVEEIFTNVKNIDTRYQGGLNQELSFANNITAYIETLANTIDPNGGNMDMQKMTGALDASSEKIEESKTSKNKTIEDSMLGTDPDAVETSIDPVNLSTGNFIYDYEDLRLKGEIPLVFHRYYNSKDARVSGLGKGFRHNYDLVFSVAENGDVDITMEDGQHRYFSHENGIYYSKNTATDILYRDKENFVLKNGEGITYTFDNDKKLVRMEDRNGLGISFYYNEKKLLEKAENDYGDSLSYEYDKNGKLLLCVTDHTGRSISLNYINERLKKVTTFSGKSITYEYSPNGRISEIENSSKINTVKNIYDKKFRVVHQFFADGGEMSFEYDDENHTVTQIERNGVKTVFVHDEQYRNTEIRYEDGTSEKFLYNDKNQCIRYTDRLGHTQRMSYDNRGNLIQKIDAAKRRMNMTYDVYGNLLSLSLNGKTKVKNVYDAKGNLVRTEDYAENGITVINDDKGRPIERIYPDGMTAKVTYDARGNIATLTNKFGGTIQYFYDELNQVTKIVDAKGNESFFEYNVEGYITKETNALGNSKLYTYNDCGLLNGITDYNGAKTIQHYNAINKVDQLIDPLGNITSYQYDKMWNVSEIILPNGAKSFYEYDVDNHLSKMTDALDNKIEFFYDANGNCIKESDCMGEKHFVYDMVGRLTEVIEPNGSRTTYEYDVEDNIVHIVDVMNNEVQMEYNAAGKIIFESNSLGEIRKYTYTKQGNIETITDEGGLVTQYKYHLGEEKVKEITYPDGNCEKFEYDLNGNLIVYVDVMGNKKRFTYDALDRVVSEADENGNVKCFSYDAVGNVIEVLDSNGNATHYEYSLKRELLRMVDSMGNVTDYEYDVNSNLIKIIQKNGSEDNSYIATRYERDVIGQVISIVDAMDVAEHFKYNGKGYLTEKIDKDGYLTRYGYTNMGDVNYIQYADGREVKLSYNVLRQLEEVKDWIGKTCIKNDAAGRALEICYPDGQTISYAYNVSGQRTSLTYPDGRVVKYGYDEFKRLVSMEESDSKTTYEYDRFSHLCLKKMPNGMSTEYSYTNTGLMASLVNRDERGIMDEYYYNYDSMGNKINISKKRRDISSENGHYSYTYDALQRLTSVNKDGVAIRSYEYDAFGNRIKKTGMDGEVIYKYNSLNQMILKQDTYGQESYSYDGRGNLSQINLNGQVKNQYVYGPMNRLEEARNNSGAYAKYEYSGLGHRIGLTQQASQNDPEIQIKYTLDITKQYNNLLQETQNDRVQTYLIDSKVSEIINAEGKRSYFLQDDMGSPIRLVDGTGEILETYGYDEFGCDIYYSPSKIHSFGFTGYKRDEISGTYYAQAREYMPQIGRFNSRDFVKGQQDDTLSMNEYVYCRDNPTAYVDMNGLFVLTTLAIIGVGAAIGAATNAGVDAISQGIKIHRGEQDEFQWGSLIGSVVEGAVVGGVGAIPGVGVVGTIAAGAVGAGAKSAISQGIDEGDINGAEVLEDAVVGGVISGVFYGIGKGVDALKGKFSKTKPTKSTADLYEENIEKIQEENVRIDQIRAAGKKPSRDTLDKLDALEKETEGLFKKHTWEELKNAVKDTFKDGAKKGASMVFGVKSTETIVEDVVKSLCPFYKSEDDKSVVEYMKDYFGTIYGKVTGKCPLYA